jgi:hypothetical protein
MKFLGIIFAIIAILLLACNEGVIDMTYYNDVYRGITYTDYEGNINGPVDNSDWLLVDGPISSQFTNPLGSVGKTIPAGLTVKPAYPNPTSDIVTLEFHLPTGYDYYVIIIDENQTVMARYQGFEPAGTMSIVWNLKDLNSRDLPSGMYRVLYQLSPAIDYGLIPQYSGYGDIWVLGAGNYSFPSGDTWQGGNIIVPH